MNAKRKIPLLSFGRFAAGHAARLCAPHRHAVERGAPIAHHLRIRPGAKGADILRNMRTVKTQLTARFKYEHIDGHMDRILLWHQLPLINKQNCICELDIYGVDFVDT